MSRKVTLPHMSGGIVTKVEIPRAFKVYGVTFGGVCSEDWVSQDGGLYDCRADAMKSGEAYTKYPDHVAYLQICPHCTSKLNWKRAQAFRQRSQGIHAIRRVSRAKAGRK